MVRGGHGLRSCARAHAAHAATQPGSIAAAHTEARLLRALVLAAVDRWLQGPRQLARAALGREVIVDEEVTLLGGVEHEVRRERLARAVPRRVLRVDAACMRMGTSVLLRVCRWSAARGSREMAHAASAGSKRPARHVKRQTQHPCGGRGASSEAGSEPHGLTLTYPAEAHHHDSG
jgi:hypothetical protein